MAFSVSYVYEIIDRYSGKLARIRKETDRYRSAAKKASAATKKFHDKMSGAQTAVGTAAGIIGGGVVLSKFISFEQTMNKLNAVTLATDGQMKGLRATAKQLGATTQYSASQAGEAMVYLGMAGLDVDKITKAIPGTLELAASSGLDLATAADIATNVLAQMGYQVEDLSRVNDVLSIAQAKANFNVLELFEAMRPAAVTAKNLGIDLEELSAVFGVMANAGEKGSIAGTLFRNALTNIAGASQRQIGIYKKLGINLGDFVDKTGKITNLKGFVSELKGLHDAGKISVPILQALFGERGFRAMQILMGAGGEEIGRLQQTFEDSAGSAAKMSKIMMKGLPGVMKLLASTAEALNIAIFESGLADFLTSVIGKIATFFSWLSKTHPVVLKIIAGFGLFLVVLGPALMIIGQMALGITALISLFSALAPIIAIVGAALGAISLPVVAVIAVVGLLIAGFILLRKHWNTVSDVIGGTINEMILMIENGINRVKGYVSSIKSFFGFETEVNIAAENAKARAATINGSIQVSAGKGSKVDRAEMATDMPGNLGFNMGPAGG